MAKKLRKGDAVLCLHGHRCGEGCRVREGEVYEVVSVGPNERVRLADRIGDATSEAGPWHWWRPERFVRLGSIR